MHQQGFYGNLPGDGDDLIYNRLNLPKVDCRSKVAYCKETDTLLIRYLFTCALDLSLPHQGLHNDMKTSSLFVTGSEPCVEASCVARQNHV